MSFFLEANPSYSVNQMEQVRKLTDSLYNELHLGESTASACIEASKTCLESIRSMDLSNAGPYVHQQLEDLVEKYELLAKGRQTFDNEEEERTYSRYCTIQLLHCNSRLLDIMADLQ